MEQGVRVIGVGRAAYRGSTVGWYPLSELSDVIGRALDDAGVDPHLVQQAYLCTAGVARQPLQDAVRCALGPDVPIDPVDTLAAGASLALHQARQDIEDGRADCVLVAGADHGYLAHPADARSASLGAAAREYMQRHQCRRETFAMIAVKARQHSLSNPDAAFSCDMDLDEVLAAEEVSAPLTAPQFATAAYGAVAILLCSADFARSRGVPRAIRIGAQVYSDQLLIPNGDLNSPLRAVGYDRDVAASWDLYERAGIGPAEIHLCELHDRATVVELLLYEALGFCRQGSAEGFIEDGDNTYGGNVVVNPSGGLQAMGFGASTSGLAQCAELVMHLRGRAGLRQVSSARFALQQDEGPYGASVVTLYRND